MISGITVHMVVKNEDQWIWYSIQSVLQYVDKILITDTGSTDHTVEIIKSIKSPKIKLNQIIANSRLDVTKARQSQIDQTVTPWIWIVDGDEIYPKNLIQEVLETVKKNIYHLIVVRRFDLLGDIYHRQSETVGAYKMFGHSGHLLIRLINKSQFSNLHVMGEYPQESYYTKNDFCLNEIDPKNIFITNHSLSHTMYLRRSSLGGNLPMFNRSKIKIETGINISDKYPEVFDMDKPVNVPDARQKRKYSYELLASIITPIKNLKRKFL